MKGSVVMEAFLQSDLFTNLLNDVLKILMYVVLGFLIAYLKEKLGNEKYYKVINTVHDVVLEMEQKYNSDGQGDLKRQAALKKLSDKLGNKLTAEQLDSLIETVVGEINIMLKKNNTSTPIEIEKEEEK